MKSPTLWTHSANQRLHFTVNINRHTTNYKASKN